ncbi:MAG: 5-dehydro-4-deoxy-D-glucuronate isomerase [Propionibacteriaceae bacterium]|jgi:4-deoxy-L-threo-5-hexosulose-uronate ketol-isomerase|nr:5-dehydro-4-deoxy-D-glucuronate isomerase [Propionibacteriaceae bacterium]
MENRYAFGPNEVASMSTEQLRRNFLVPNLFCPGEIKLVYTHQDRVILGGVSPMPGEKLTLEAPPELRADHFLERREAAVICIAGHGAISVDGVDYDMPKEACLYLGRGTSSIAFQTVGDDVARFYLFSAPAHTNHPLHHALPGQGDVRHLGDSSHANQRDLNRIIIPETVPTCQIEMGLTRLVDGSLWNTMPAHTHERRMECYLYIDLGEDDRVVHLMGQPQESRHIIVANEQAVIAPDWSLHAGVGTRNYAFIWAMAGENQDFDDMDAVPISTIR